MTNASPWKQGIDHIHSEVTCLLTEVNFFLYQIFTKLLSTHKTQDMFLN